MREIIDFNDDWLFDGRDRVRLPHNAVELPLSYFDETAYQRGFSYEKRFEADPAWAGREAVVHFEAAMANARVYLNDVLMVAHPDGYTPFELRLTGALREGENVIRVEIDGSENPAIPPFGGQIDYLTYAGIYRDTWLKLTAPVAIGARKIETPDVLAARKRVVARVALVNPGGHALSGGLTATLIDPGGRVVATTMVPVDGPELTVGFDGLEGIALWDIDAPALYTLRLALDTPLGADRTETRFGFREARFAADGFFLNGRRLKLRGLNRHQSFPYAGYALGRAAQARDAEILKRDLGLNMVRTSHYPQSTWFLDACDALGLLVFEEIPGWQHIGDAAWKAASVENVRAMIRRDWNHPSVVIWGVRINESADDPGFYAETNRVAHALDPTRQTGGVRCIAGSELLEDVYTMNDFVLLESDDPAIGQGPRRALRPQQEVTGLDRKVPYLVTEYGGHMYPTKSWDQEQRQAEHVTRHLEVLDAAYAAGDIAGAIGWCAFDYNTHKDFGSGDRICHHGVMDMFRMPKFAAAVYASQAEPGAAPVLEPVTFWARGERNVHGVLPLIILTNCEEVVFRYGDREPVRFAPARHRFPNLPHPPVIATYEELAEGSFGGWGMEWLDGEIAGLIGGEVVATRRYSGAPVPRALALVPDATTVAPCDELRVTLAARDQAGNRMPFIDCAVELEIDGPARLIGPPRRVLRGGVSGLWLRATGVGKVTVRARSDRFDPAVCSITAVKPQSAPKPDL